MPQSSSSRVPSGDNRLAMLANDAEKWTPVIARDHAIRRKVISLQGAPNMSWSEMTSGQAKSQDVVGASVRPDRASAHERVDHELVRDFAFADAAHEAEAI